jgi:hypothetical protein
VSIINAYTSILRTSQSRRDATRAAVASAGARASRRREPRVLVAIDPTWAYYDAWAAQSASGLLLYEIGNIRTDAGLFPSSSPDYSSEQGFNRNEPFRSFSGNSGERVSISFTLSTDGSRDRNVADDIESDVMRPATFFKSLLVAWRTPGDGVTHGPPPVIVTAGTAFSLRGVITEFDAKGDEVVDPLTCLAHRLECTLTVESARRSIPPAYPADRRFV